MNRSTLPRHARTAAPGWAHPYPVSPFSPYFYADGEEEGEEKPEDKEPDDKGDQDGEDTGDGGEADPEGAEDLGDKGKRALASMKGKWRTERDKRQELEQQLADKDGADEAEAARRTAEQAALAKANDRILKAEVKAAAKGVLADPSDAYKFLDLGQFEVDDDGNVDSDEITEAIENLIKTKPYLAAATAKRFQGTGDGGAARKAGVKQVTEAELKTMSPEAIVKAQKEGRLNSLLGAG